MINLIITLILWINGVVEQFFQFEWEANMLPENTLIGQVFKKLEFTRGQYRFNFLKVIPYWGGIPPLTGVENVPYWLFESISYIKFTSIQYLLKGEFPLSMESP